MSIRALEGNYNFYKLLKDIPGLNKGAIFYWDKDDKIYGSIGEGCLKLCWTPDGDCYNSLCGDTIIFHASVRNYDKWFKLIQTEYIETKEEIVEMTLEEAEKELKDLGYNVKIKCN